VINAFALKVLQNKGLLQPYAAAEAANYPTGFKDPQNFWVSLYSGYNVIGFNTKLVSNDDVPKTWEDLLHPRWKANSAWMTKNTFGTRECSNISAKKKAKNTWIH
jgi:ABC-type Fe3+ transport system substrate-binding protein